MHNYAILQFPPKSRWLEIEDRVFYHCFQLTTVNGCKGLEEIGEEAFCGCRTLHKIFILPTIKAIMYKAFFRCLQVTTVTGVKGLKMIGKEDLADAHCFNALSLPLLSEQFTRRHSFFAQDWQVWCSAMKSKSFWPHRHWCSIGGVMKLIKSPWVHIASLSNEVFQSIWIF